MPSPNVVLVGRPNVGKSTLFNRIVGARRAIVAPVPGTTRDVIRQTASWGDLVFTLTDTGGMFGASDDPLQPLVVERGRAALDAADLVVFVVDGREGLVSADETVAQAIRSADVPVIVAVNKLDDSRSRAGVLEFHQLGFEPVIEVSAEHGLGTGDLLDEVVARLAAVGSTKGASASPDDVESAIVVVGRPNVGKSSLVNRLLHDERMVVSDVPGTTRDAVDSVLQWHRRQFRIVDTAGMRRPGRVAAGGRIEAVSVMAASRAVADADVVVVVIDATEGVTDQDAAIAGEAERAGCGLILAANKWDVMKGRGEGVAGTFDEDVRFRLKFLDYVPLVRLSARTGERVPRLLTLIDQVARARQTRVKTGELNAFIEGATARQPPVSPGSRRVRILYAAQTRVAPPTFVFFTNVASQFHFSYERYLVNQIRKRFGFVGTPIRIQVRRRSKSRTA